MSDDKVVKLSEYKTAKQLEEQMQFLKHMEDENQKSLKQWFVNQVMDKSVVITRSEIQDNFIHIDFIRIKK